MFKVRFNLSSGKNYMKWQVIFPDGSVHYLNPEVDEMILTGCKLRNQKGTAKKIFDGAHKTVCAWVQCEDVRINYGEVVHDCNHISYNPRVTPNWMHKDKNVDGTEFDRIVSKGRKLFSYSLEL